MNLKFFTLSLLSISWATVTAQTTAPAKAPEPTKPVIFDIVSIRENRSNMPPPPEIQPFAPTTDGYRMTGMPLAVAIIAGFVPQHGAVFMLDQVKGLPDWSTRDRYDIQAKVSDSDLEAWRKPDAKTTLFPAAMQAMLLERCKLVTHREMKEISVSVLVVGKDGPKLQETNPADRPPAGMSIPGGAIMVQANGLQELYGTTMNLFATYMTGFVGKRVEDGTGLTGKYNINLKSLAAAQRAMSSSGTGTTDPDAGSSISSALAELGLKLTTSKGQVETLVIDHIEKPSEN